MSAPPATRAYLDVVSTATPDRVPNRPWRGHVIRVSCALEEGRKITAKVNLQVKPEPGWEVHPAWCRRYGANAGHAMDSGRAVREVAESVWMLLDTADVIVCHSAAFHTGLIAQMMVDAGLAKTYSPESLRARAYDTMAMTAEDCRIPSTNPRAFKQPRLPEAVQHFTGEMPPDIAADGMPWWKAGLVQMTSLRTVFWAKHRWGIAPEILAQEG